MTYFHLKYKPAMLIMALYIFAFSFFSATSFAETTLTADDIVAEAAILIDQESGQILFQKNIHKSMYPASITKIMTAILVLEDLDLSDTVVIDHDTPFSEGNRIWVNEGEIFSVEQLLYATMVESANDAAVALAKKHSGTVEAFAEKMNARAAELGALNTHFVNPNGLPNEEHVTTAYDMALIGKYAMTFPKLQEIVTTTQYQIPPTNKQSETRYMTNSNRFLYGTGSKNQINYNGQMIDIKYDAVQGIKTGYTVAAGQTFVSSGVKDDKKFISVVLKSEGKNLYVDTRKLLDYGFDNFERQTLAEAGEKIDEISFEDEKQTKLAVVTKDALIAYIPTGTNVSDLSKEVNMLPDIALPVEARQKLGTIQYTRGDLVVASTDLVAPGFVSDKPLLDDDVNVLTQKDQKWYAELNWTTIGVRAVITLLIWRLVMTWYNLQRRKYMKRMKAQEEKEKHKKDRLRPNRQRSQKK